MQTRVGTGAPVSQAGATALLQNTLGSLQTAYNSYINAAAAGKVPMGSNSAFLQSVADYLYSPIGASQLLPGGGALLPGGTPGITPANIVAASQFSANPSQVAAVSNFFANNYASSNPSGTSSSSGSSIGVGASNSSGAGSGAGFSIGGGGGGGIGGASAGGISLLTIGEYAAIGIAALAIIYWILHRGSGGKKK